ncbi:unnamed protein product [Lota lota]
MSWLCGGAEAAGPAPDMGHEAPRQRGLKAWGLRSSRATQRPHPAVAAGPPPGPRPAVPTCGGARWRPGPRAYLDNGSVVSYSGPRSFPAAPVMETDAFLARTPGQHPRVTSPWLLMQGEPPMPTVNPDRQQQRRSENTVVRHAEDNTTLTAHLKPLMLEPLSEASTPTA